MEPPLVSREDDAPPEDRERVIEGLRAHNRRHAPAPGFDPLNLFLRDPDGTVRGGLLGETGWEWLHVHVLWVAEEERGRGHGSRLLLAAETGAMARGCRGVLLDTFEFQALPFYQARGYEVFGVLEDYPPGSRRYFLSKRLSLPSP